MISFESDYICGAHPGVLERLVETNMVPVSGYGCDPFCHSAEEKIRAACQCPEAQVRFITGGTQTNQLVISTILTNYQGVVAARTGHVSTHEGGAIEYTGHKVLEIEGKDGKIAPDTLRGFLQTFWNDGNHEHMVEPGMVYISFPTEYGTLYTKKELTELYAICREYEIPLFIDGARLGYGLASSSCDLTLPELAQLCDVFYIGGTKVGALCGEAVVFTHNNVPKGWVTQQKQHGALLAKGRLIGVQFDALFTEGLYLEISRHAIRMAEQLKQLFLDKGYPLFLDSPTNQQFVILENTAMEELKKQVAFSFWEAYDETHTVVRFATSWSTKEEEIQLLADLL
ncbi:MAG: beta-eliminating lyase-related protein [Lachnospiraceae bacterium]|nr:beta-eliminating lyase-related protein [Lachnospiraceae bacterium]